MGKKDKGKKDTKKKGKQEPVVTGGKKTKKK